MRRRISRISAAAALISILFLTNCRHNAPRGYKPSYRGARYIYKDKIEFDDGDTFLYEGRPFRFLGIDCPEVRNPNVGIEKDQPFGREAAESTAAWIMRAHTAEYIPDGRDYYGRRLVHIMIDGKLLAVKLLRHALAYETVTHFGDNGFPDLAQKILDASIAAPKPDFEEPYKWRKKHQKKRRRGKKR